MVQEKNAISWEIPVPYIRKYKSKEELASRFLAMVAVFNGINLTNKELEFLSVMMLRDNAIVGQLAKKLYREKYNVSGQVVDNMICTLKKKGILIKEDDKVKIHPRIAIKLTNDNYIFQFKCQKN